MQLRIEADVQSRGLSKDQSPDDGWEVGVEPQSRKAKHGVDGRVRLSSSKSRADAPVRPGRKGEMKSKVGTFQVKAIRVVENVRVTICGRERKPDELSLFDLDATKVGRARCVSVDYSCRWLEAK